MKTPLLILCALLCGCANEHTLKIRDYDSHNNKVTQDGQLVPFTNWGIGFYAGTNWIKVMEAKEQ